MEVSESVICPFFAAGLGVAMILVCHCKVHHDCEVCCRPFEVSAECDPGEFLSLKCKWWMHCGQGTVAITFRRLKKTQTKAHPDGALCCSLIPDLFLKILTERAVLRYFDGRICCPVLKFDFVDYPPSFSCVRRRHVSPMGLGQIVFWAAWGRALNFLPTAPV